MTIDPFPPLPTPVRHPAIEVVSDSECPADALREFLDQQTETSVLLDDLGRVGAEFVFCTGKSLGCQPPTHLESLLIAAAAENHGWVIGGWSPPARGRFGPSGDVLLSSGSARESSMLLRLSPADKEDPSPILGRSVAHIREPGELKGARPIEHPLAVRCGPYRLHPAAGSAAIIRQPVHDVDRVLANLPPMEGPRTVLFLLPYLAIGGAERLLLDLIGNMCGRFRVLIVTTDPHLEQLGQTVEKFRRLTPHLYTLGDWVPQQAVPSAIRHLVRRWRVESLMCWNGNVVFYDHVADLKRRFESLRIVNHLFNHEGGWIEHYCRSVIANIDCHVAVNTAIRNALVEDRAVPESRVRTIHHGVEVPSTEPLESLQRRCVEIRTTLGIPLGVPVVGTFIRLHAQKRPLDVLRIARQLSHASVHFLLVGGGPLERTVDRELQRHPLPNLTRLPMQQDPTGLYDIVDVCLLTSSFEGLPVFLLDGLARGIPCVAPAVGEIPVLLENGGGIVVATPGDIKALAAALLAMVGDPERRKREGELGRTTVRSRFSLRKFVSDYEAVIFPSQ